MKINLALAELPDFTANPGTHLQEHHTGSVEMAPTMEYIERAFIDAREGRPALRPFSDGVIPTAFDTTLCPEGYHIMSLFTQWVPADWNAEPHREELQGYADRMIDVYNEVAPGRGLVRAGAGHARRRVRAVRAHPAGDERARAGARGDP